MLELAVPVYSACRPLSITVTPHVGSPCPWLSSRLLGSLTGLVRPLFAALGGANVNQDTYQKVLIVGCRLRRYVGELYRRSSCCHLNCPRLMVLTSYFTTKGDWQHDGAHANVSFSNIQTLGFDPAKMLYTSSFQRLTVMLPRPPLSLSPLLWCVNLWYTGHLSDTCVHLWGNSIRQPSKMDSLWLWHMIACLRNSLPLGLQECCRSVWVQMHMHTVHLMSRSCQA